jgi:putative hydrolase of the HAD superfamily
MTETWVGFDADDTLWHNESYFMESYDLFADVAAPYLADFDDPAQAAHDLLIATETVNIPAFGYGIKGATISMIEAAITASGGAIPASELMRLINRAKAMMAHPVEFLDGAVEALDALSHHRLVLLTKGDLKDQHRKIDASALAERFDAIEILHEKDETAYLAAFARHSIDPSRFVMIGNSLKSDILPILGLGGWAIHVPYVTTWAIEHADEPTGARRFVGPATLWDVPALVETCLGDTLENGDR